MLNSLCRVSLGYAMTGGGKRNHATAKLAQVVSKSPVMRVEPRIQPDYTGGQTQNSSHKAQCH